MTAKLAFLHDPPLARMKLEQVDGQSRTDRVYRHSRMPALIAILENLWIQHGPMLNQLYPDGHPTYDNEHQHLGILRALRRHEADALCSAVREDMIQGGRKFVVHLQELERREAEGDQ